MSDSALQVMNASPAAPPFNNKTRSASARVVGSDVLVFGLIAMAVIAAHAPLLRLPYFWDEAGYYVPAARDLLAGSLIPYSTPSNAHPPLVMAWIALAWKIFGQKLLVTRVAMLLLAAFSLTGLYRLARTVSNHSVAIASTFLTAIYPVFFAQSSLAQVDLPAAGLTFWALEAYVRRRRVAIIIGFSLAALAKETAILVPLALAAWELISIFRLKHLKRPGFLFEEGKAGRNVERGQLACLLVPLLPLSLWYLYHYARTGFVFGNPEFFQYNLQRNFRLLRIFLALLLRIWQTFGYLNLYLLTLAGLIAMKYPAMRALSSETKDQQSDLTLADVHGIEHQGGVFRARIAVPVQLAFCSVAIVYLLALSVLGGAVLARYMLPIVPLFILISVSTIWRRLRAWKIVLGVIAAGFVIALFVNPPYGFSPEDTLAYCKYVRLHQNAENFIEARYPQAPVLTAWPASDELSRPNLGYVRHALPVVRIEDFTPEQVMAAADEHERFDVALVFSTKVQPALSLFDRWRIWHQWKTRYFGYHVDLNPESAAAVLGGSLVYVQRSPGQWVAVIAMEKMEDASAKLK